MKKTLLALATVSALAGLCASASAQNLAVVNGKSIPLSRVDALAAQLNKSGRPVSPDMMSQLKEEVIAREIFSQEASKQGIDASEDFKNQLDITKQTLLIRELFTTYQKNHPVTDAEIKAEYDKFVASSGGKEYRARHILVAKEEQAKAILASLKKGAKFEDLAKKQSSDSGSAANGGDLDWSVPSNYVKEFGDAMVALGKGKITETPVKTQFGYHIIRLDDVRDAKLPKLDEVKAQLSQQLAQKKIADYQEELRKKARVQ